MSYVYFFSISGKTIHILFSKYEFCCQSKLQGPAMIKNVIGFLVLDQPLLPIWTKISQRKNFNCFNWYYICKKPPGTSEKSNLLPKNLLTFYCLINCSSDLKKLTNSCPRISKVFSITRTIFSQNRPEEFW